MQERISDDPSLLNLGDLELRGKERRQPRGGRLDLLLQDLDTNRRFEVEIQLGATDESHIIRTIEYWDIERKRYPQYDHCAVIIAEEITARFLNVISLFNGTIPLIAIQMKAIQLGDIMTLVFTKVLDEMPRGLVDEDEDAELITTDRPYWEAKGTPATVALADEMLTALRKIDPEIELKYNKHYIGLTKKNQAFNIVSFRPKKKRVNVEIKLLKTDETDRLIEDAGFDTLEYNARWQQYRLSLTKSDVTESQGILEDLFRRAYAQRMS